MLDGVSFNRLNPNSRSAEISMGMDADHYNQQTNSFEAIPEEKMFMVHIPLFFLPTCAAF